MKSSMRWAKENWILIVMLSPVMALIAATMSMADPRRLIAKDDDLFGVFDRYGDIIGGAPVGGYLVKNGVIVYDSVA